MVDTSSLMNVMYRTCFDQMGLGSEQLSSSTELLYGFTRDAVVPVGWISLLLTIGDADRQAPTVTNFLILDCPSAYNIVLRRPAMNDLDLVTSIRSLIVKFLTPRLSKWGLNGRKLMSLQETAHDLSARKVLATI